MWIYSEQEYIPQAINNDAIKKYELALASGRLMENLDSQGNPFQLLPHSSMVISKDSLYGCGLVYRGILPGGTKEAFLDGNNTLRSKAKVLKGKNSRGKPKILGESENANYYVRPMIKLWSGVEQFGDEDSIERLHYFLNGHIIQTQKGEFLLTGSDVFTFSGDEIPSIVFGKTLSSSVPSPIRVDLFSCNLLGGIVFSVHEQLNDRSKRSLWSNCLSKLLERPFELPKELSALTGIRPFEFKNSWELNSLSLGVSGLLVSGKNEYDEDWVMAAGRTGYYKENKISEQKLGKKDLGWYSINVKNIASGIRTIIAGSIATWILDNTGDIWCCGKIPIPGTRVSVGSVSDRLIKLVPDSHRMRNVNDGTLGFEQIYESFGNCLGTKGGKWYQWGIPMELVMRVDFEYKEPDDEKEFVVFIAPLRIEKLDNHKLLGHFGSHALFAEPPPKRMKSIPKKAGKTKINDEMTDKGDNGEKPSVKSKGKKRKPDQPLPPKGEQEPSESSPVKKVDNVVAIGGNGVFGLGSERLTGGFPQRPMNYGGPVAQILKPYHDIFSEQELKLVDHALGDESDLSPDGYAADIYVSKLYHHTPVRVKGFHYDPIRRVKLDENVLEHYYSPDEEQFSPEENNPRYARSDPLHAMVRDYMRLKKTPLNELSRESQQFIESIEQNVYFMRFLKHFSPKNKRPSALGKRKPGEFNEDQEDIIHPKRRNIGCSICPERVALYRCGDCKKKAYCSKWCLRHDWNAGDHHKRCSKC